MRSTAAKIVACLAIVLLMAGACVVRSCVIPQQTAQGEVGLRFARALVAGEFEVAHRMLEPTLAATYSPEKLGATFREMVSYGGEPPTDVRVVTVLDYWPAKQPGDVGWAYVAISGNTFSEAVTVTVTRQGERALIREIEWGRP